MENNTFAEIERGYAVWLEPTHLHFHPGNRIEIKALWGNKMQKDGIGNPENWKAFVTDPSGKKLDAEITYGEGLYAGVYFEAEEEGLYHVMVENDAGVYQENYYSQWAGLLVPVGHHIHGRGIVTGHGLEIVAAEFKEFCLGDTVTLQVLFNRKLLPGIEVKATYHLYEGPGYPYSETTGDEGRLNFTFDNKGHWMFLVNYKENVTGQEYKTRYYTSTFVVPGVR